MQGGHYFMSLATGKRVIRNKWMVHNQDGNHEQYDNEISIEDKLPEDMHITINDINTVHEMNAGQLHVDPNTGEEMETEIETDAPTHR